MTTKRGTTRDQWDAAAPRYADTIEQTTSMFVDRLVDAVAPGPDGLVADVACGTGVVTLALAERGSAVLASDHSDAMVEILRARARDRGFGTRVSADVADAMALPYEDDTTTAAVSNFGVIFAPDIERAFAEMRRVTEPGGMVAISAWSADDRGGFGFLERIDPDALGFAVPTPAFYAWATAAELADSLGRSGLVDVEIAEVRAEPMRVDDIGQLRDRFGSPAFQALLEGLDEEQRGRLVETYVAAALEECGEPPFELSRSAWLARGRVV